ncbi:MAG TPA: 5'-nucleotidase [Verrucomicrobiae bacterium]
MNADLHDTNWMRCGISLLWDAEALNRVCPAETVRSLREFFRLYQAGWPEDALKLANGRAIVIAGLEAAMDTLAPDNAVLWLEKTVYPAILDFQEQVADGGREAALIFWLADGKRVVFQPSDATYHWHCSGEHRDQKIPIGRCIWNGAEGSAQRIIAPNSDKKPIHVGLYQQRIS